MAEDLNPSSEKACRIFGINKLFQELKNASEVFVNKNDVLLRRLERVFRWTRAQPTHALSKVHGSAE